MTRDICHSLGHHTWGATQDPDLEIAHHTSRAGKKAAEWPETTDMDENIKIWQQVFRFIVFIEIGIQIEFFEVEFNIRHLCTTSLFVAAAVTSIGGIGNVENECAGSF
jgi:hypothetical protein